MGRSKLIALIVLCGILTACGSNENIQTVQSDWNGGYCSECGGELMYKATSSQEHYVCDRCGKEYTFDGLMKKEKR